MTQMLQVVAGKPSPLSYARGHFISLHHLCPSLLPEPPPLRRSLPHVPGCGEVPLLHSTSLLNCVTSFWALNLVSECAETWLPVTS